MTGAIERGIPFRSKNIEVGVYSMSELCDYTKGLLPNDKASSIGFINRRGQKPRSPKFGFTNLVVNKGSYGFETHVDDLGFFSRSEVESIDQALSTAGFNTDRRKTVQGHNIILVRHKSGLLVRIDLGEDDFDDAYQHRVAQNLGLSEERKQQILRDRSLNSGFSEISLIDPIAFQDGKERLLPFHTDQDFAASLSAYVEVLEPALNAIAAQKEENEPMRLRLSHPPTFDYDDWI